VSRWTAPVSALMRPRNDSPVPLTSRKRAGSLGTYALAGSMLSFLEMYANDPVVRPIVARLTQAVSETKWHLYVKSRTGSDQDRTEITKHPLLDLLAKPNQFQSFAEIMARGQQHWELVGETSIVLGFVPGVKYPLDMWVLRPDRITPVPDPYAFLAGWIYAAPGDGEKIPLETGELLRMVDPDPTDPYRGQGAVQSLLRDLDAQRFTKEWQAQFFNNSAQPGGMIIADHRMDDTEFEEVSARWNEQHKGVSKAHRVAILENMQWVQNSFSLKDLQLAEFETLGRDKTLAAFGMPKSIIGIVEDVNRANAEAGEYLFARWMTRPRLVHWRSMLNSQLLPYFDPQGNLELDFDDPVPQNSEANVAELVAKSGVLTQLAAAGFDVDAVLELLDWPDIGYEKPAPSIIKVPSTTQPPAPALDPGEEDDTVPEDQLAALRKAHIEVRGREADEADEREFDNAMRWVSRGHPDANCCDPCRKKIGTLYRNRTAAYKDYPPGKGYVNCVGAQYGNHCRCRVVKRRSQRDE